MAAFVSRVAAAALRGSAAGFGNMEMAASLSRSAARRIGDSSAWRVTQAALLQGGRAGYQSSSTIRLHSQLRHKSTAAGLTAPTPTAASPTFSASAGLLASLLSFPVRHPFTSNVIIATAKTSAADLIAQTAVEGKGFSEIDWQRNAVFIAFGAVYIGVFQYFLQVRCFSTWFKGAAEFANSSLAAKCRDKAGLSLLAKQIGFDCGLHLPFIYLPTFYVIKESVTGKGSPVDWVKGGTEKYVKNFSSDVPVMLKVWFPADILCFTVPMWLRLPIRHAISLGWTTYLSFLRGN